MDAGDQALISVFSVGTGITRKITSVWVAVWKERCYTPPSIRLVASVIGSVPRAVQVQ